MSSLSLSDLMSFHVLERELFKKMVIDLGKHPVIAMQIIALWLWLEQTGFPYIIEKMFNVSDRVILNILMEIESCLNILLLPLSDFPPTAHNDLPILAGIMNRAINLNYFYTNRNEVVAGMVSIMKDVCLPVFDDIINSVPPAVAHGEAFTSMNLGVGMSIDHAEGSSSSTATRVAGASSSLNPSAAPWVPLNVDSQEDRTMFITFSRGYPLSEQEIRDYFTMKFGDCVQAIHLQGTAPGVQALYARLVFFSVTTIPDILQGKDKAKFVINGKHVWARPFIPKKRRSSATA